MTSTPIKAGALALAILAGGCGWNGPTASRAQLVQWARCLRAHGVPGFPDPDARNAFDSSRFDDTTPAFHAASQACAPVQPAGAVAAVPGHPRDVTTTPEEWRP